MSLKRMLNSSGLSFFLAMAACGFPVHHSAAQSQRNSDGFRPIRVVPEFPAIQNPPIIPASKVRGEVQANELVLGVVVNGQARAYPINMMTGPSREIINDTLGGRSIAATW